MQLSWLPYTLSAVLIAVWNWMPCLAPDLILRIILIPLVFHLSDKILPLFP
jgi:hypothetical protein